MGLLAFLLIDKKESFSHKCFPPVQDGLLTKNIYLHINNKTPFYTYLGGLILEEHLMNQYFIKKTERNTK